jgi:hypothetical protein
MFNEAELVKSETSLNNSHIGQGLEFHAVCPWLLHFLSPFIITANFFGHTRVRTQGLMLARWLLYHTT